MAPSWLYLQLHAFFQYFSLFLNCVKSSSVFGDALRIYRWLTSYSMITPSVQLGCAVLTVRGSCKYHCPECSRLCGRTVGFQRDPFLPRISPAVTPASRCMQRTHWRRCRSPIKLTAKPTANELQYYATVIPFIQLLYLFTATRTNISAHQQTPNEILIFIFYFLHQTDHR